MAAEEIIVSIKIDETEAQQRLIQVREKMEELTKTKKQLAEAYKEGWITQEQYAEQLATTEVSMRALKTEMTNLTKGQEVNNNSINALRESTRRLTQERNNLDLSTAEGRKRLEEINAQLDENTEKIRANMDAATKQKMNIGNYKDALGDLFPAFGQMSQGVEGTGKAMKVLATNPLLMALTALVGVVMLLYKAFTGTAAGADLVEETMAKVTAIFDVLMDRVGRVAGALVDFFSGDFSGAAEKMSGAFSGVGDEMANAAKEAVELKRRMNDLEDAQIDFNIASAETENKIKRLLIQAKDRTLTEEERMKKIEEATALEKGRVEQEIKLADEALSIAANEAAQRLNIVKKANESEIEFGKRVVEAFKADNAVKADDLRSNVEKMLIARENANGKSLEFQEKINQKADDLETKAQEKREKAAEKARQVWEKETKARVDFQLYGLAQKAKTIEEEKVIDDASLETFKKKEKNRLDILIQIEQEILQNIKKNTQLTKTERELAVQKQNDKILQLNQEHNAKIAKEEENLKNIRQKNEQDILNLEVFRLESKAKAQEQDAAGTEESYKLLVEAETKKTAFLLDNDKLTDTERELIKAQSNDRLLQLEKDKQDKIKQLEDKKQKEDTDREKALKDLKLKSANEILNGLQSIAAQGTILNKAAALTQIGIDTAQAITALTKASEQNPANGLTFGAAGTLQFAAGIVRVLGNINQAKKIIGFAEGGLTGTRIQAGHGIPIARSNGDNILATVKTGEVILNQRQQAALGGSATFKRIGVPGFADGGLVSNISLANASRQLDVNDILNKMSAQKTVLVLQDFEAAAFSKFDADRAAVV